MILEDSKIFTFEASHLLPRHPGRCHRLHGHTWRLVVSVKGLVNGDTGFVIDYGDIKKVMQPIVDNLDHRHLGTWYHPMFNNDFTDEEYFVHGMPFDFYPSSENLIVWIADQIGDKLDYPLIMKDRSLGVSTMVSTDYIYQWSRLELDETCTSKCILLREDYERGKNATRNG